MDVPVDVTAGAAVAALVQAIAAKEIERPTGEEPFREALEESYCRAARYGLQAQLVDGNGPKPAREVARRTLEHLVERTQSAVPEKRRP